MQKLNYVMIDSLKVGDSIEVYTNNEDDYRGEVTAIDLPKRLVTFTDYKSKHTLVVYEKHIKNVYIRVENLKVGDKVKVVFPAEREPQPCEVTYVDNATRRVEVIDAKQRLFNMSELKIVELL